MGSPVSPYDVVANGSRHLHAIQNGVVYEGGEDGVLAIESLDAALVAPGDIDHLLDFTNDQPDCEDGMHFNLYNNLWGTAFPQYYGEDAMFRFSLKFDSDGDTGGGTDELVLL